MIKKLLLSLILCFSSSIFGGLQSNINQAACILEEQQIPYCVLRDAKGIVVMSIVKGGFIFSGRIGSGIVVARTKEGWSAPSAIGMAGAGWGLQAGAQVTDFVLVLNTQGALDAFSCGGSVTLGGNLSVAAGPIGGSAEGSLTLPPSAIFSYSRSKGLFAGVSLEGAVILERSGVNRQFYGRHISASEILSGDVPPPKSADNLYRQL